MTDREFIALLEKSTGLELNEEKMQGLIDRRLKGVLSALPNKAVSLDEVSLSSRAGFSRFLGDVRRLGMGSAPKHLARGEMVHAAGPALSRIPASQAKDLREGATTAGGYLVSSEQAGEVLNLVNNYSAVKDLCRQVPMSSHQITFPTISGGVTAYWVPEASESRGIMPDGTGQANGEIPRSDATFGQLAINAHVLAVKVVVSNQLLDDSDPSVDKVLENLFAETIGQAFDVACLRGAGAATDPITGLAERITTNAITTVAFDFGEVAKLIFAVYENAPHAAEVPVLGHPKAEKTMMGLKDQEGNYIFRQPGQPRLAEGDTRPRIWGEPFVRDPNIITNLGKNQKQTRLFAGDFASSAIVGQRTGMVVKTNPWAEPYFSYNQTAFLAEIRIGFAISDEKRFAMLSGVPTS